MVKAKTIRLNTTETEALINTSLKINRDLVKMGKMPLKDTEICHAIIEQTLINGEIEVKSDGSLRVISHEFIK
jgi:hypothetical protein